MLSHLGEMLALLDILAYILKSKEPDKMELLFTMDRGDEGFKKHSTQLVDMVKRHFFDIAPDVSRVSNMERRLEILARTYNEKLKGKPKARFLHGSQSLVFVRPISVYIFTDANWQPASEATEPIKELVKALEESGKPKDQVSIQFIQFGNDLEGTRKLNFLDNGLNLSR